MDILLLVVKDCTSKQTQKQMKASQVGMGSTSTGGLVTKKIIFIYIRSDDFLTCTERLIVKTSTCV